MQKPKGKRPRPPAPPTQVDDRGRHIRPSDSGALLRPADTDALIEGACRLLRDTGCAFETGSEAMDLFDAAGCDVMAGGLVRFPTDLVHEAIATTAKSALLWDREGTSSIRIDTQHTWFIAGMTAIRVFDTHDGTTRSSSAADLVMNTRIADSLPNIDAVCITCKDVDRPDSGGEVGEFAILVRNTTKPLEFLCEDVTSLAAAIDIASRVRGSGAALREKPYFLHTITPLPLMYWHSHIDQLILAARSGIPQSIGTLPIGGASAPITMAGCMLNSLATDFAGMVLAQLAAPGSFAIGSSDVRFMEPATGSMGNTPQVWLTDIAIHEVRRKLGLPSFCGIAGRASARRFNQDAVWEISGSMAQAFFSRPATLDYLGLIDNGMAYSLHALCFCDELAGMLRTMWQGLHIDDDTMALDLAHEVGPRGNYLAQHHTARHCRDQLWPARYFGAHLPLSAGTLQDTDLVQRIDADLRHRLATHRPAPLRPDLDAWLSTREAAGSALAL